MRNEKLDNSILFLLPALIWGSTWLVIKFQLGVVDPVFSVSYRFLFAGIILLVLSIFKKLKLKFSLKEHLFILIQGACLFGLNYWLVYMAELTLTSGLVAVIFSLIVFTNMIFSALVLKSKITWQILVGGVLAILGTALIFKKEFMGISEKAGVIWALTLCFISLLLASLGNIISGYNQKNKLPVIQTNAFGMLYGSVLLFFVGIFKGAPVIFDFSSAYILSMMYLTIFGSVIAFTAYLKLLGKIGPSKSAYIVVIVPILSMILSTIFEDYQWQRSVFIGMPVLIIGNLVAMNKIKLNKLISRWK